jgi:hypothetical protein
MKIRFRMYNEKGYQFIYDVKKEVYKKYVELNWGEWNESKEIVLLQLSGLLGRYTVLDDNAFYQYILRMDNVVDMVKQLRKEKQLQ